MKKKTREHLPGYSTHGFFLRVVIINTKESCTLWPLQSLYSSERDLNKQTLLHPAPPRIKWERLWCTGGSFTYRTSSVSPLLHAHTHSRAQLSHWPWFPVVTVCARVVGRAFLLSVLEILLIQLIHTNKQTDTRVDGQREGRTGGRKVSLLCDPSLQGSTRAGSPTFLLCLCSLTLKVHCVVKRREL